MGIKIKKTEFRRSTAAKASQPATAFENATRSILSAAVIFCEKQSSTTAAVYCNQIPTAGKGSKIENTRGSMSLLITIFSCSHTIIIIECHTIRLQGFMFMWEFYLEIFPSEFENWKAVTRSCRFGLLAKGEDVAHHHDEWWSPPPAGRLFPKELRNLEEGHRIVRNDPSE